jgi:hypothetical protein
VRGGVPQALEPADSPESRANTHPGVPEPMVPLPRQWPRVTRRGSTPTETGTLHQPVLRDRK